jgi:hypothetical protein
MLNVESESHAPLDFATSRDDISDRVLIALGEAFDMARAEYDRHDADLQVLTDRAWDEVEPPQDLAFKESDHPLLSVYDLPQPIDQFYDAAEIHIFRQGRNGLTDEMRTRKREIIAAWDQWLSAVSNASDAAGGAVIQMRRNGCYDRIKSLGFQIAMTPGRTLAGAAVKARLSLWSVGGDENEFVIGDFSGKNIVGSLIADLITMKESPSRAA